MKVEAWAYRHNGHGAYWDNLMLVPPGEGPDRRPGDWCKPSNWVRVPALDAEIEPDQGLMERVPGADRVEPGQELVCIQQLRSEVARLENALGFIAEFGATRPGSDLSARAYKALMMGKER